ALRRFQADRGIPANGVAGPATLAAMQQVGSETSEMPNAPRAYPGPSVDDQATESGAQTAELSETPTDVDVSAVEHSFTLRDKNGDPVTSVPAGVVAFRVKNNGTIAHDFSIAGQKTPTLAPDQSETLTVTLEPGQASYASTVGEQASLGMSGSLTVT